MKYYKRVLSFLIIFILLPLACIAEEEDFIWEEEDLSARDTLLATDIIYHTPSEHSAVRCSHAVC